jgi:hypothetical protein
MSLIYIKEAMYQFADLYLPGKWFNSRASSKEFKRRLEVPDRSFGGF